MRLGSRYAGLLFGLFVWALCPVLILLAPTHAVPWHWGKPLIGVVANEDVAWTWPNFLHGRVQARLSRTVGQYLPLFRLAVRLRNQAEWSLLHHVANPLLIRGRGDVLFEGAYIMEYCSRDIAAWRPGALVWARRIREMQDVVERRGHAFLYLITPSKAAQYPDFIPANFTCPASEADRKGLIPAWVSILHQAGVHVVDTTAPLMAAHAEYPFWLWANGGTHWNSVGAAIGTQALVAGMNSVLRDRTVAPLSFTWTTSREPIPPDDDLYLLANLLRFPKDPSVRAVPTGAEEPESCRAPRVVIVGGSFTQQILGWLSRLPCSVPTTLYGYWQRYRLNADGRNRFSTVAVDPAERDADVLSADLLIYEENEQVLSTQQHGTALWTMLREKGAQPATEPVNR